jgi:hypothetical protein
VAAAATAAVPAPTCLVEAYVQVHERVLYMLLHVTCNMLDSAHTRRPLLQLPCRCPPVLSKPMCRCMKLGQLGVCCASLQRAAEEKQGLYGVFKRLCCSGHQLKKDAAMCSNHMLHAQGAAAFENTLSNTAASNRHNHLRKRRLKSRPGQRGL